MEKKTVKLYNVLFPIWMLMLFPLAWLIVLPANYVIDSLVLIFAMKFYKIADSTMFHRKHILKVFFFGLLSDYIGAAYMLILMLVFKVGSMGDEWFLTVPAIIIAAVCIFLFNYFSTFKDVEKPLRLRLAIIYAVVTAPYTFLIPSNWIY